MAKTLSPSDLKVGGVILYPTLCRTPQDVADIVKKLNVIDAHTNDGKLDVKVLTVNTAIIPAVAIGVITDIIVYNTNGIGNINAYATYYLSSQQTWDYEYTANSTSSAPPVGRVSVSLIFIPMNLLSDYVNKLLSTENKELKDNELLREI